ncbi:MAG: hypothetical protein IJS32_02045 [Kiritimatiellae bacterium]|nr:hypothetical protein [Kiritimatiellia bacterium]
MKKFIALLLAASLLAVPVFAQEEESAPQGVPQGQLAQLLVKTLGLAHLLPAVPTDADCFAILAQNGIAPADGWTQDGIVTQGVLARVLVQALGLSDEVENPADPLSWIAVLESNGISLDRITTSVESAESLPEGIFQSPETTDPLFVRDEGLGAGAGMGDSFATGDLTPASVEPGSAPVEKPQPVPPIPPVPPRPHPRPTPTPH